MLVYSTHQTCHGVCATASTPVSVLRPTPSPSPCPVLPGKQVCQVALSTVPAVTACATPSGGGALTGAGSWTRSTNSTLATTLTGLAERGLCCVLVLGLEHLNGGLLMVGCHLVG